MTTLCKHCGKEIVYGKNFKTGRRLPLEVVKGCYMEMTAQGDLMVEKVAEPIYVLHLKTCAEADRLMLNADESNIGREGTE